jgi:hypothetical protein
VGSKNFKNVRSAWQKRPFAPTHKGEKQRQNLLVLQPSTMFLRGQTIFGDLSSNIVMHVIAVIRQTLNRYKFTYFLFLPSNLPLFSVYVS